MIHLFLLSRSQRIQARLDALPTENEGALTLPELLFLIGAIKVMAICVALFDAADADGSGVLESSEIKNVLIKLHETAGADPPSDADMDAMIEQVGGEVTLEQFSAVMIPIIVAALGDPVIE
jgi:Ca2+-binding EF-hand superfamily protein